MNIQIKKLPFFVAALMIFGLNSCALLKGNKNKVTTSFTVYGNCEMCKERIENALDRKGIQTAYWSVEEQKVFVTYQSDVFSEEQLHNIMAMVGHDTDKVKADNIVYQNLPGCCHYRKEEVAW
jgi:copper chaperone CopZ